jgi:hypothetical protein
MIIEALGKLYKLTFGKLQGLWQEKVGGSIDARTPAIKARMSGRVINPGDPDWIPSPKFVPPAGWKMPDGWQFDPHLGWSRVVEFRNSRTPDERMN